MSVVAARPYRYGGALVDAAVLAWGSSHELQCLVMHSDGIERIVISVGGSLIVPAGGIDTKFLAAFRRFVLSQVKEYPHRQLFLITGGGQTNRLYNAAAQKVGAPTHDDLDWIGIKTNFLNAELLRAILGKIAHPAVLADFTKVEPISKPVAVVGSWKPGRSSDFVAVKIAGNYGAKTVVNLSNIAQVYDKDPKKVADALPLAQLTWQEYSNLVGDKWVPRLSSPFDPIAAKEAARLGIRAVVMHGGDLANLEAYLKGRSFTGTVLGEPLRLKKAN